MLWLRKTHFLHFYYANKPGKGVFGYSSGIIFDVYILLKIIPELSPNTIIYNN